MTDDDWISQFMEARSRLNLDKEFCFMPAPDSSGRATVRALDSDECGAWMCKLLEGREGMRTTSHSLKSTTLSYCAKYGIGYEDRLALGGHSHPYRMADVYSRDALARPLRLLDEVLTEIREHRFFPDCTRAGRFADVLQRNDPVFAAGPLEGPSQKLVKEDTLSVPWGG